MHAAEMSDSWQNAANSSAEARRVTISATFALLPNSPASSLSKPSEGSTTSAMASFTASATDPVTSSVIGWPESAEALSAVSSFASESDFAEAASAVLSASLVSLASPDTESSANSFSNPASAASSSSSEKCDSSGSNLSSVITGLPWCWARRLHAGRFPRRSAAHGPAP